MTTEVRNEKEKGLYAQKKYHQQSTLKVEIEDKSDVRM